jgi:hypothetical protein
LTLNQGSQKIKENLPYTIDSLSVLTREPSIFLKVFENPKLTVLLIMEIIRDLELEVIQEIFKK